MMEELRRQAINETFEQWKEATRKYYTQGYDSGETTKLYKELERLGANIDILFDTDLEIREEVFSSNQQIEGSKA